MQKIYYLYHVRYEDIDDEDVKVEDKDVILED